MGVQAFPAQKRRFQSALDRVEWKEAEKARGAARPPMQERERAVLLAWLLVSLQQPPTPAPQPGQAQPPEEPKAGDQPKAGDEEAGFEFWDAAQLARQGKFADAIRALGVGSLQVSHSASVIPITPCPRAGPLCWLGEVGRPTSPAFK
jgi:hypothetical protein